MSARFSKRTRNLREAVVLPYEWITETRSHRRFMVLADCQCTRASIEPGGIEIFWHLAGLRAAKRFSYGGSKGEEPSRSNGGRRSRVVTSGEPRSEISSVTA